MNRTWAVALLLALVLGGCASVPDADVPNGLADDVESARSSLRQHGDGPLRSAFVFRLARCRADGGLLVVFDQLDPFGRRSHAFAMRGPGAGEGSWAGGFGAQDLERDPEIAFFFSESPEAPCD